MSIRLLGLSLCFLIALAKSLWAQEDISVVGSQADLDQLIATLEDTTARDRLIAQLEQLRQIDQPEAVEDPVKQVVDYLKEKQDAFDRILLNVVSSWNRIPEFVTWLQAEMTDPFRRGVWLDVSVRLSVVFFSGWVVAWVIGRLWQARPAERQVWSILRALLRELVIMTAYALTALSMLYSLEQPLLTRLVGRDLLIALIGATFWRSMLDCLLRPFLPAHLGDVATEDLVNRLIRAGVIGFAGYFILLALLRLGLPWSFHTFGLHIVFLVTIGMLIAMVVRIRQPVAEIIQKFRHRDAILITRVMPVGLVAQSWHLVVIGLILAHYVTWALSLKGGLYFLAQATGASIAIMIAARLISLYNDRLFSQGVTILPADDELMPEVQERAARYANPMRLILRWVIVAAMLLALSWVWRTGLVEWLGSPSGQAVTATIMRLALLATATILLTEGISIGVNRFVQSTTPDGQPKLSNRGQTIASLLKNVTIVMAIAVALMLALSEVGVDAAALLAGAGVIGLAIGFGSQRLVQDLINGLFILLGDTVRVGDVIEAAGKAGSVESMSMRTISLRAYDGNVHTIPYSSIDTVTNMTKDYSFAVFDIGISYGSDLELAFKEMQSLDQEIRREWPYRRQILAPLEIAGVDALGDSAVVIKSRLKVRAGDQWSIRREFTKRIKYRFDAVGIEIPFPHRTLLITNSQKDASMPLSDRSVGPTIATGN